MRLTKRGIFLTDLDHPLPPRPSPRKHPPRDPRRRPCFLGDQHHLAVHLVVAEPRRARDMEGRAARRGCGEGRQGVERCEGARWRWGVVMSLELQFLSCLFSSFGVSRWMAFAGLAGRFLGVFRCSFPGCGGLRRSSGGKRVALEYGSNFSTTHLMSFFLVKGSSSVCAVRLAVNREQRDSRGVLLKIILRVHFALLAYSSKDCCNNTMSCYSKVTSKFLTRHLSPRWEGND